MTKRISASLLMATTLVAATHGQTIPVEAGAQISATTASQSHLARPNHTRDSGLTPETFAAAAPALPDRTPQVPFDTATMMDLEDLRPGMKGYGLSVFSGLEPERFEAEVIGVRHSMMADTDIILCRLKSPHLIELGVIAGMSGSPVYIDDKLIGAVAYGFMDVDDPLAGVTPIRDMLEVYNSTPVKGAQQPPSSSGNGFADFQKYAALHNSPDMDTLKRLFSKPSAASAARTVRAMDFGIESPADQNIPDEMTMRPLSAPIMLQTASPQTAEIVRTLFSGFDVITTDQGHAVSTANFAPPSAPSASAVGGPLPDLAAFSDQIAGGYALAVPFVEGDLNMAGVGTVTWRHENRLVAFGHPMMQSGSVYFPMAAARISALVRSRTRPFKLGEPIGHVGMVRQDRHPAIGGLFGETARMVPLTVTVDDPAYMGKKEYNFRLLHDRSYTPMLLTTAIFESLGTAGRFGGDSAALFQYTINTDDGTSITVNDYLSDTDGSLMAAMGVMSGAGLLLSNPYTPAGIEAVDFRMQVVDRLRFSRIESAVTAKTEYRPGETVQLEWLMRPYREEPVRMTYEFTLPADLPNGEYDIVIGDNISRRGIEQRRNPETGRMRSYQDILRVLKQSYAANRIYISMVDKDTGLAVQGSEMPKLPASVIGIIQDTVHPSYVSSVRGNYLLDTDIPTSYEVSGQTQVSIKVERRVD